MDEQLLTNILPMVEWRAREGERGVGRVGEMGAAQEIKGGGGL